MAPAQVKKTIQVSKTTKAYHSGSPISVTKPSSPKSLYPSLETPRSPKYVQKKLIHAICKDCYKPRFSPPWVRTGAALKEHPYGLETDYDDKLDWAGWKYTEAKQIGPVLQRDGYFYRPTEEWPLAWLFRRDIEERRVPWKLDPLSTAARKVYCYGTRDMVRRARDGPTHQNWFLLGHKLGSGDYSWAGCYVGVGGESRFGPEQPKSVYRWEVFDDRPEEFKVWKVVGAYAVFVSMGYGFMKMYARW